jgi:hypothetical protein
MAVKIDHAEVKNDLFQGHVVVKEAIGSETPQGKISCIMESHCRGKERRDKG